MGVRITGASELSRDLARARTATPALVRAVVAKAAADIEAEAKLRCPVDTGRLKNSITTSAAGDRADLRAGQLAAVYEVGPTADYGAYVELGTRRMAPQPYLMPAADKVQPQFERAMEQVSRLLGG